MTKIAVKLGVGFVAIVAVFVVGRLWSSSQQQQEKLNSTISDQQTIIKNADRAMTANDKALKKNLANIAKMKAKTRTPAQILKQLPQYIALPQPIELEPRAGLGVANSVLPKRNEASLTRPDASVATVKVPEADLSPLFDFAQSCRECEASTTDLQKDLLDEKAKEGALTTQRDTALNLAKGGTLWKRIRRDATWLGIGIATGYIISLRMRDAHLTFRY